MQLLSPTGAQRTWAKAAEQHKPSESEWSELIRPKPGEGDQVVLNAHANDPLPQSIQEFRQIVSKLDYQPFDPFVSSVGASIGSDQSELPKGEKKLKVSLPEYYSKDVELLFGGHNGPHAPMLVILPGIFGAGDGSHNQLYKKLALERGMNYLVVPNSLNEGMMDNQPIHHPGNPRVDAMCTHALLSKLKGEMPEFFEHISVAGYSYGGLHGANLVRLDEERHSKLIDGSLVAVSPPENLEHSMRQLDGLRQFYEGQDTSISQTGLQYKRDVKKYGYADFAQSDLAAHASGSNITEIEIADKYGSRDGLKKLIEAVDVQFHHNLLPKNTQEYQEAGFLKKHKMRQEHDKIVENITYDQFSSSWMRDDAWLVEQGLTPSAMAEQFSFSKALGVIHDTPVMVLAAKDDYILNTDDVAKMYQFSARPDIKDVAKVFDHGGHVGVDWNPQVAQTLIDFAKAGPEIHKSSH